MATLRKAMARSMNGTEEGSRPLSQIAYDALRTMILSGEVRPGERLGERELARRIQVSRTPLREALGRLERDGLAVSKPGLGYFAMEFDAGAVQELYELREILEVHASRLAARRIGDAGIRELRDIMQQLAGFERKKKLSIDELREEVHLGLRIHEVIARESGNTLICDALYQLYDRLRLLTWIDVLWFDTWAITRREHRNLVAAVVAHDADRAAKVAQRHVRRSRDDAVHVIKVQRVGGAARSMRGRPIALSNPR
jgi:DNA-binding GntR family transcriptional regulator